MKKEDLIVGEIYCAEKIGSGKVVEAVLDKVDNGFGYAVLTRVDDKTRGLMWNIDKPPQGLKFYKKQKI